MVKWVYSFGPRGIDGSIQMRETLGGKGASLADMSRIALPVPPGFTLTTSCCRTFFENNQQISEDMLEQIDEALLRLEGETGKSLGSGRNPLVLAVRPGAKALMPGMIDSVLCVGLNEDIINRWLKSDEQIDAQIIWNAYRRFVRSFAEVVLKVDATHFDKLIKAFRTKFAIKRLTDAPVEQQMLMINEFKQCASKYSGKDFPDEPKEQLILAIKAGFLGWNNKRAVQFRKMHNISDKNDGAAVTVQLQVLGINNANLSGTGVCWSRDLYSGESKVGGTFVVKGIGEDYNDPNHNVIHLSKDSIEGEGTQSLETIMPWVWRDLVYTIEAIEKFYGTMRMLEFVVADGQLWLVQSHRAVAKTPRAALKIATNMVQEGLIRRQDAVTSIQPEQLESLIHPSIIADANSVILTKGVASSPGAAVGRACFSAKTATERARAGEKVILIAEETHPNDVAGIIASAGVLTSKGGLSSHAAVIARGMNRPCVSGASNLHINKQNKTVTMANDIVVSDGDWVTIDGSSGECILGKSKIEMPDLQDEFQNFMQWVERYCDIEVRANAESIEEITTAKNFGASGLGLIRSEFMLLGGERLSLMQQMILSDNETQRKAVTDKLLPYHRQDFVEIFQAINGLKATIRLLDPPLHEFVFDSDENLDKLSADMKISKESLINRINSLRETNPMLGHRGVRLAVTSPDIYKMQAKSIFEAAALVLKEGIDVTLEIMIPLVSMNTELTSIIPLINKEAKKAEEQANIKIPYKIGTMVETPRAALKAADLAKNVDFFSFGTNDLTQMTWGVSRDDSASFMRSYQENGILKENPFSTLDQSGVGELIQIAIERGRKQNSKLYCGICGEHGGDPKTIDFCYQAGIDYVSCSPWRVPIAKLAIAHAFLKKQQKNNN